MKFRTTGSILLGLMRGLSVRKDALPVHLDLAADGILSLTAREPFHWLRRLEAVETFEAGGVDIDRYLLADLAKFGKDTIGSGPGTDPPGPAGFDRRAGPQPGRP